MAARYQGGRPSIRMSSLRQFSMSSERLHLYIGQARRFYYSIEKKREAAKKEYYIPMVAVAVVVLICRREFMAKLEIDLCVVCWPAAEIYKAKNICRLHYKFQDKQTCTRIFGSYCSTVQLTSLTTLYTRKNNKKPDAVIQQNKHLFFFKLASCCFLLIFLTMIFFFCFVFFGGRLQGCAL